MSFIAFSRRARQVKAERRPATQFALGVQQPAMALDDGITDRQTQAQTLSYVAGGKERLEHARKMLIRNARPIVPYRDLQPLLRPLHRDVDRRPGGARIAHG